MIRNLTITIDWSAEKTNVGQHEFPGWFMLVPAGQQCWHNQGSLTG